MMIKRLGLMGRVVLLLLLSHISLNVTAQEVDRISRSVEEKYNWCRDAATKEKVSDNDLNQLRLYLRDSSLYIRSAAAKAVGQIGDNSAQTLEILKKNLDSVEDSLTWDLNFTDTKDEVTRASAAYALLHLGDAGKNILRDRVKNAPTVRGRVEAVIALRSSADSRDTIGLGKEMASLFFQMDKIFNPDPQENKTSILQNAVFEHRDIFKDWSFHQNDANGKAVFDKQSRRQGSGSIQLSKESNDGEVYLRSNKAIRVKKDEDYLVRLYFRADDAPTNSTLQILFENKDGELTTGTDKYAGEAQTFIRNSPTDQWIKRTANIKPKEDGEYYIRIALRGNKSTVWIDDITAPAINMGLNLFPMEVQLNPSDKKTVDQLVAPNEAVVKKVGDRTRLLLNGDEVVPTFYHILGPTGQFGEYKGMEEQGKVKLHVVSLDLSDRGGDVVGGRPVWPATNEYDFSTTFERIEYAVASAPNSNFILNINVLWPEDWIEKNPDETWQNIKGQRGYGMSSQQLFMGFADELPAGFKWWPSPFSEKAIADAQKGIHLFINELKKRPYFNKFVGCHIAGGHDGQFNTSGRPDYSPIAQEAFKKWLKELYHTDQNLQKKWNDPIITFATVEVPDYANRKKKSKSDLFYDPETDQRFIDHTKFQSEQGMIIRDQLAKAFKEAMGRPVIGMTWGMGGGRGQGTENIFLPSRHLDVIVAQPSYARRLPGYIGGMRNAAMTSYNEHGKMLVKEFDFRTWLRNSPEETYAQRLSTASNPKKFISAFRKEFMQMMVQGLGFWMYDIGRTHFRDPEMLRTIAEGVGNYENFEIKKRNKYRPEVAMVWVDESILWEKRILNTNNGLTMDGHTNFQIAEAGFTYDNLYLADILKSSHLQEYKMYIFKDSWRITESQRREIEEKLQKEGKVLVWNYAAGYIGDDKLSDEYVSQLTKINIKSENINGWPIVRANKSGDRLVEQVEGRLGMGEAVATAMAKGALLPTYAPMHRFIVQDNEAKSLALYPDRETAIAVKRFENWTSVYFGMIGTLDARLLNNLAEEAGIHTFTKAGKGNVEFNGSLLGIHCLKNENVEISLPFKAKVVDFDSKKVLVEGQGSFNISMNAGDTRLFVVESLK